ncbi:hypothetical protein ABZ612_40390 [Streptomyces avermitilis]|uniref:hypothetical protein n=1 Tax=Streptomyces avermitilis TaxID=33903 RepID=UPI0033F1E146
MLAPRLARGGGRARLPHPELVDHLIRSYTRLGYQTMVGGIHTQKPHLAPYYEAGGFQVLPPGAPLVLQLPVGGIQWPADASMRLLARRLAAQVSLRAGVLNGLLASPPS